MSREAVNEAVQASAAIAALDTPTASDYWWALHGYSPEAIGAAALANAGGAGPTISVATTDVTASELKNLSTVGKELIPAPGAGKALFPMGVLIQVAFGTTAFTDPATSDIVICNSANPTAPAWIFWEFLNAGYAPPSPGAALFIAESDAFWIGASPSLNSPFTETTPPFSNRPIGVCNYGGDLAVGDGSVRFIIYYATVDLA